jgi:predicted alpha/beta superfamily hydrolase
MLLVRRMLSPQLRNFRNVVVALPPGYHDESPRRYPVVYLQDGQNLFDPVTSYSGDWKLGPLLDGLAGRGAQPIVVGIANARTRRLYEYSPFPDPRLGGGGGDRYLAFLTETVKPSIDRAFRTLADPQQTVIAGSSMGGLFSLYAGLHRPEVFGTVGALSPSLWFADRRVFGLLETGSAPPRVYLDIGLLEPAAAVADVRRLRELLERRGLREGADFRYHEDPEGRHDEETWGRRLGAALPFLLAAGQSAVQR